MMVSRNVPILLPFVFLTAFVGFSVFATTLMSLVDVLGRLESRIEGRAVTPLIARPQFKYWPPIEVAAHVCPDQRLMGY